MIATLYAGSRSGHDQIEVCHDVPGSYSNHKPSGCAGYNMFGTQSLSKPEASILDLELSRG